MDSIKAHAHVLGLLEGRLPKLPEQWTHDLATGALSYRFDQGPNTFTWDAGAIARMPLDLDAEPPTEAGRRLLDRWARVREMLNGLDRPGPDKVMIDHGTDEMTLLWQQEKLAVVIEP